MNDPDEWSVSGTERCEKRRMLFCCPPIEMPRRPVGIPPGRGPWVISWGIMGLLLTPRPPRRPGGACTAVATDGTRRVCDSLPRVPAANNSWPSTKSTDVPADLSPKSTPTDDPATTVPNSIGCVPLVCLKAPPHKKSSLAPCGRKVESTIARPHDSRIPMPGTILTREYKGETVQVTVLPDGFDFEGEI